MILSSCDYDLSPRPQNCQPDGGLSLSRCVFLGLKTEQPSGFDTTGLASNMKECQVSESILCLAVSIRCLTYRLFTDWSSLCLPIFQHRWNNYRSSRRWFGQKLTWSTAPTLHPMTLALPNSTICTILVNTGAGGCRYRRYWSLGTSTNVRDLWKEEKGCQLGLLIPALILLICSNIMIC